MEKWHNLQDHHLKKLKTLDNFLIQQIIGAHSKVPVELLFLETSSIPIDFVFTNRQLNYLHTILNTKDNELTKNIYMAQNKTMKGDWAQKVGEDITRVQLDMDENNIKNMNKIFFFNLVSRKVKTATFCSLKETQSSHIKVSANQYTIFVTLPYPMPQDITFEESSTIFNIRANTLNGFKSCFPSLY